MIEIIVASLCIGNFRCDQATKAYLVYNPAPKIWMSKATAKVQDNVTQVIGQQAAIGIATGVALATQKTYQVRVTKHWSIGKFENVTPLNTYTVPGVMYGFNF